MLKAMGSLVFEPPPAFFLFTKTQYSSNITQKIGSVEKNDWWIYIEKSQFQTKIENFEIVF